MHWHFSYLTTLTHLCTLLPPIWVRVEIHIFTLYTEFICVWMCKDAETRGLSFHCKSEFFRSSLVMFSVHACPYQPFFCTLNCLNSISSWKNLLKKSVFHISVSFCLYLASLASFVSEILLFLVVSKLGCILVYRAYRVGTQGLDLMILVGHFQLGYFVILCGSYLPVTWYIEIRWNHRWDF